MPLSFLILLLLFSFSISIFTPYSPSPSPSPSLFPSSSSFFLFPFPLPLLVSVSAEDMSCKTCHSEIKELCPQFSVDDQIYIDANECEKSTASVGWIANFQTILTDAASVGDETCYSRVSSILCAYTKAATMELMGAPCQLKKMCQFDCDKIRACVNTAQVNCHNDSGSVAPGTMDPATVDFQTCVDTRLAETKESSSSTAEAQASTGTTEIPRDYSFVSNVFGWDLVGRDMGNVSAFLGLPYAEPLTQANQRWRAPSPVNASHFKWISDAIRRPEGNKTEELREIGAPEEWAYDNSTTLTFRQPSNVCMQLNPSYTETNGEPRHIGSEDCLYMNIYTPYLDFNGSAYNCSSNPCVAPNTTWIKDEEEIQQVKICSLVEDGNSVESSMVECVVTSNQTLVNCTLISERDPNCLAFGNCTGVICSLPPPPPLLPVLVYIHGGDYANGSAYDVDGSTLVRSSLEMNASIIVVTFNYRLGIFGFLAHKDLSLERSPIQTSGLYAIEDQKEALKFIHDNIQQFGGDRYRVTLLGDSSGATLVCLHLLTEPTGEDELFFHRAVLQGRSCTTVYRSLDSVESVGSLFATSIYELNPSENAGCNPSAADTETAKCLRAQSNETLYEQYIRGRFDRFLNVSGHYFGPLVDAYIVKDFANAILQSESHPWNAVPVLAGTNTYEYGPMLGDEIYLGSFDPSFNQTDILRTLNSTDVFDQASLIIDDVSTNPAYLPPNKGQPTYGNISFKTEWAYPSQIYATFWNSDYWDPTRLRGPNQLPSDVGYDASNYQWSRDAIVSMYTSQHAYCPHVRMARAMSNPAIVDDDKRVQDVFIYRFSYQSPYSRYYSSFNAAVSGELLPYLFATPFERYFPGGVFHPTDYETIALVQYFWLNFIYTGSPVDRATSNMVQPKTGFIEPTDWNPHIQGELDLDSGTNYYIYGKLGVDGVFELVGQSDKEPVTDMPPSPAIIECLIWDNMERTAPPYTTPRQAVDPGSAYVQYSHCYALPPSSFCSNLLNYSHVNIRGPFNCLQDVEEFLNATMPTIVAQFKTLQNFNISKWPVERDQQFLDEHGLTKADVSTPKYTSYACADYFSFVTCRFLYRPCKPSNETQTQTNQTSTSTTTTESTQSVVEELQQSILQAALNQYEGQTQSQRSASSSSDSHSASSRRTHSASIHTPYLFATETDGGDSTSTPDFIQTVDNSVEGFTAPPCASLCHNYHYYCPQRFARVFIAPTFDLHLPKPLKYTDIFDECLSTEYWQPVTQGCPIFNTSYDSYGQLKPMDAAHLTECNCQNETRPNVEWFEQTDTPLPQAESMQPKCESYTGKVCAGIINYPVYIAAGSSQSELESQAEFLIPLQKLATVETGCRESFARLTCSSIFMRCEDQIIQEQLVDTFGGTQYLDYSAPFPAFPCQTICQQADAQCQQLFEVAPESRALVQCDRVAHFEPFWEECPDPLNYGLDGYTRYPYLQQWREKVPDYPEGPTYPYRMYQMESGVTRLVDPNDPKSDERTGTIALPIPCNNFEYTNRSNVVTGASYATSVPIDCPFPLVIPDDPTAATYKGGSCALPCPSLIWTPEQWVLGDIFFNLCVLTGFLMSAWLAISYSVFPANRERYTLWMFFLSVGCSSFVFICQVLYSAVYLGFRTSEFGCINNSELSRQSDGFGLCEWAGGGFMYFINASVQWWMVLSLDLFNSLVRKKKYSKKQLKFQRLTYHALAWVFPALLLIIALGNETLGRTTTVPWCFMHDDVPAELEWGVMWFPMLIRLVLGMIFMGLVAVQMYKQGSMVEARGQGSRWAWFRQQMNLILLVSFFCLIFAWLAIYRAYMWFNAAEYSDATERFLTCLIYDLGDCGQKPTPYPVSQIWYGVIACVGAQGVGCGLFFGFERRNRVLWWGWLHGRGKDFFIKPDVDPTAKAENGSTDGDAAHSCLASCTSRVFGCCRCKRRSEEADVDVDAHGLSPHTNDIASPSHSRKSSKPRGKNSGKSGRSHSHASKTAASKSAPTRTRSKPKSSPPSSSTSASASSSASASASSSSSVTPASVTIEMSSVKSKKTGSTAHARFRYE